MVWHTDHDMIDVRVNLNSEILCQLSPYPSLTVLYSPTPPLSNMELLLQCFNLTEIFHHRLLNNKNINHQREKTELTRKYLKL